MKKYGFWLMNLAGLAFLVWWLWTKAGTGDLRTILKLLPNLSLPWLAAAVVFEAGDIYSQSMLFKTIFGVLGFRVSIWRIFAISLVSGLVGRVVPFGVAATVVTFISTAKREGLPASISTTANALYYFFDYAGFCFFLVYALIFLKLRGFYPGDSKLLLISMLIVVAVTMVAGALALRNPGVVISVLKSVAGKAAKIPGWLGRKASHALSGISSVEPTIMRLRDLFAHPKTLISVMTSSFFITFTDVLLLYSLVRATGDRMGLGALTVAFTIGTVATLLTFIPNGTGVYVVSIWGVLTKMGLQSTTAGTVAMVYRFVSFYLPTLAGLVGLRYVRRPGNENA